MFGKMTLKSGINTIVILILLIITLFQILTCYYFFVAIREQAYVLRETSVTKFSDFISQHMKALENKKNALASSPLLLSYITDMTNAAKKREFSDLVYTVQLLDSDVLHVLFFDKNGSLVEISNNISADELAGVRKSYECYKNAGTHFMSEYSDFFASASNQYAEFYFLKFTPVYYHDYKTATNVFSGALCIFTQTSANSSYHLQSANENITIDMYSENAKISAVNVGEPSAFSLHESFEDIHIAGTDWYFSGSVGYPIKYLSLTFPALLLLNESLLLIVFVVGLNRYLHIYILRPFGKILSYLNTLKIAEKFAKLDVLGNSEMQIFAAVINDMVLRNKELANEILENQGRIYSAETSSKDAIIYALQNQINPHYMYNIFEIIRSIACVKNAKEIETIVVNMSEILRYNLRDSHMITVLDEYNITLKYLEIMKVKYNGKIFSRFELPDDVLRVSIMKMMFQPIVENAFNHGYIKRTEGFGITISGRLQDDLLVLEFYDNGRGISKEELEKIHNSFADKKYISDSSIGLKNLNYRLKTFYDYNSEMLVESVEMEYTRITIRIKLK